MTFEECIEAMKNGKPVQVPSKDGGDARVGVMQAVGIDSSRIRIFPHYFTAVYPNDQIELFNAD